MKKHLALLACSLAACVLFTGCSNGGDSNQPDGPPRDSTPQVLVPEASGKDTQQSGPVILDSSNSAQGYLMIKYSGSASKVRAIITAPGGSKYTYQVSARNEYSTFPITGGTGTYKIAVFEGVDKSERDDLYSSVFSKSVTVSTVDEFKPYLYPNLYVNFDAKSNAVAKGKDLATGATSEIGVVENIYKYVISNVTYDEAMAQSITFGYVPDVDAVLSRKSGICFDYASLMAAMLRSQGIPTKLEVGYSGEALHAWISVYTKETGWIDKVIEFDGKSWILIDPTLAASNDPKQVQKYIGDGSRYTLKYLY